MAKCIYCGKEFDKTYARRVVGHRYGAGSYNDYYSDGEDVCEDCASTDIGAAYYAGLEIKELMGTGWEDD